ncbi:hypothetical protein FZI91_12775 [Mycobacterium sp. CBMA271]|uniref:hypothetical protein n=1 Tax=unclassified Mycobacteroides TaxID=2618759 RepID=UPI0012DDBCEE|nr:MULTISPECIES: hypothetical protein [unclassified Mycobacteroides]MUM18605.1 hypothetical protein [Mycobacteroides sp. CBMA 326]MUM22567.1 hypothetical protein [Mycobacteroides sp. CBMA 271]
MAIGAQGRGRFALVMLFFGMLVALPTMLHCVPGGKHPAPPAAHHLSLAALTIADSPTPGLSTAADHAHADNAVRTALCRSVDGLAAALRGNNEVWTPAAVVTTIVAAAVAVLLFFGISRDPPLRVTGAALRRSGRVLLTDLCIIRR